MFSTLQRHNRKEQGFKVAKFDAILDQARGTTIESGLKSTECYGNDSKAKIGAGQVKAEKCCTYLFDYGQLLNR